MMPIRILVVDDDPGVRELIAMYCRMWGYEVETACDGEEGLVFFAGSEDPPRMIVSDWIMPGINGVDLCTQIKNSRKDGYYYFIMITGKSDIAEKAEAFRSGVDDFLSKPLDFVELQARVEAGRKIVTYAQSLRDDEFRIRMQCYQALVHLAEKRDAETGSHLLRIGEYSAMLADAVGKPSRYMKDIRVFSQFHDIGKVGIPDQILLAPRKLTAEEFEIMKSHTLLGWQILKDVETMSMGAEIALSHHEKFNGSGYPNGIAGKDIPLSGRIVAIADVYDALRTPRVYKKEWTREEAATHILTESGRHFDPELVRQFKSLEPRFDEVSRSFRSTS